MAKHLLIVSLAWAFVLALWAPAAAPAAGPLAHTYSIVARDPRTGEMGVAVQSHWFGVGTIVAWAEAGVGAVATQSFVEPAYGPRGLELMRTGLSAPDALKALLAADPAEAVRQIAFVDSQGRVATHTGARCVACAGHLAGAHFSVQANMMLNDAVVPAMRRAFEASSGPLAERLMAALEAAEAAGGDIRGRQAAAILVVPAMTASLGALVNVPLAAVLFTVEGFGSQFMIPGDRKSTRLNSSHVTTSRMPSSA